MKYSGLNAVLRRELRGYFITPIGYIVMAVFLLGVFSMTFYGGNLYERGQADLSPFFALLPWFFMLFAPAVSMRLWADERRSGTFELLSSLPIPIWQSVCGKFLAAWIFVILTLLCTLPLWVMVSYLGDPDHGLIIAGYWAAVLSSGVYLALSMFASALTRNQVVAFLIGVSLCAVFTLTGSRLVLGALAGFVSQDILDTVASFSVIAQFEEVQRGVISIQSVSYFLLSIIFWLYITTLGIRRLKYERVGIGLKFIVSLFVFVIFVTAIRYVAPPLKVDMTAEEIYTVSQDTKEIVRGLDTPLTLKFYYTPEFARGAVDVQNHAQRVTSMLSLYERISRGKVKVENIVPAPFSQAEDDAMNYGVQSIPVNKNGDNFYFGLVGVTPDDDFKAIKYFDPRDSGALEQDVTQLIYDLAYQDKPTVTLVAPFRMETQDFIDVPVMPGIDEERWHIVNKMAANYGVVFQMLNEFEAVPPQTDILMLVHPYDLSEVTQKSIAEYLNSGGKAILFLDPYSGRGSQNKTSSLNTILSDFGLTIPEDEVVLDEQLATRMALKSFDTRLRAIDRLDVSSVPRALMSDTSKITAPLKTVRLETSGHIQAEDQGMSWTPLLLSSNQSTLTDFEGLEEPETLRELFKPDGTQYTLAGRLSSDNVDFIVVADSDLLRDQYWVQKQNYYDGVLLRQTADNAAFVLNSLDALSGRKTLSNLRSRRVQARPFTRVQKMRSNAEAQFLVREKTLDTRLREMLQEIEVAQNKGADNVDELRAKYRDDIRETRRALKKVRYDLRKDIECLGVWIKAIHIGLIPFLIICVGLLRRRKYYK